MKSFIYLLLLLAVVSAPRARAGEIYSLLYCQALLVAVHKDSAVPSMAKYFVRASVAHMKRFRETVLDPRSEAKPQFIKEGVWTGDSVTEKERNAVASEIVGLENHYEIPRESGEDPIAFVAIHRKGPEAARKFAVEWLNAGSEIKDQFGFAYEKFVIFSNPPLVESKVHDIVTGLPAEDLKPGQWVFGQTAFKVRKTTLEMLRKGSGNVINPFSAYGFRLEAESHVGGAPIDVIPLFFSLKKARGLGFKDTWNHLFKNVWVVVDYLVEADAQGQQHLSVVARFSEKKPKTFGGRPKREKVKNNDFDWGLLGPALAR